MDLSRIGPVNNPNAFLVTFESGCRCRCRDKGTWVLQLVLYLTGEAQVTYMALSGKQARDYEVVKAAILDWVGLSTEKYRQK